MSRKVQWKLSSTQRTRFDVLRMLSISYVNVKTIIYKKQLNCCPVCEGVWKSPNDPNRADITLLN